MFHISSSETLSSVTVSDKGQPEFGASPILFRVQYFGARKSPWLRYAFALQCATYRSQSMRWLLLILQKWFKTLNGPFEMRELIEVRAPPTPSDFVVTNMCYYHAKAYRSEGLLRAPKDCTLNNIGEAPNSGCPLSETVTELSVSELEIWNITIIAICTPIPIP
jgi:hypothetical protein